METIRLKSSVNWATHYITEVRPVQEHPDERWFKFITQYPYKILKHERTKMPDGISFHCGPIIMIGDIHPAIGMPLKDICKCINNKEIDYILIFDYDISGDKETGTVS